MVAEVMYRKSQDNIFMGIQRLEMPTIINIRQDPFERTPSISGQTLNDLGGGYMNDWLMYRQCATRAMTSVTWVGPSPDAYGFAQGRAPGAGSPSDGWSRRGGWQWPRATAPAIGRHGPSPASSPKPHGRLTCRGPLRRAEGPGLAGGAPTG